MSVPTANDPAATATGRAAPGTLLSVADLHVTFGKGPGAVHAVRGVDLDVDIGEAVGVVGESGSGKSVTGRAVMGILDPRTTSVRSSRMTLKGAELPPPSRVGGKRVKRPVAMVFQNPFTSLNPVFKVGTLLSEVLRRNRGMNKAQARTESVRLLDAVRIPDAASRLRSYPHEFSGGMQQRIVVAMALALEPELLIADEPTTALDVTVQAEIVNLLRDLQEERRMGVVFISHDLGLVSDFATRVYVMYAGRIAEDGGREVMTGGRHPYTRGLVASVPSVAQRQDRLRTIPGTPPLAGRYPDGCAFHPRCPYATDVCRTDDPERQVLGEGHHAACHHVHELPEVGR
ncbi:MAG: ATP-binding cassette domain-containing protein [Streptosporangiales bacterium]|nr:ATP-binding cassette domain-containing protein [Streptosporangiales bacterium]